MIASVVGRSRGSVPALLSLFLGLVLLPLFLTVGLGTGGPNLHLLNNIFLGV